MAGNDVEIRVRIRDETRAGYRDVDGRLRDMRGRFAAEGNAAGNALNNGISKGVKDAANSLGKFAAIGSFANLAGLVPILFSISNAALLVPGAISVAAAAISTFQVAVSGVGEALGAMGTKSAGGGGGGGGIQSSARAIRDAVDSINDAKKRQAQVAEDTSRDIARAERDVSRASQEAARDVARAKQDQARTERDVADQIESALEQQQKATENLDDARVQAARTLDDLRDRVRHYANDEEDARIAVLSAYAAQRKVNADVTSTNLEKLKASQAIKDAEERLADTQKSRTEDTAKLAAEEAKGVEGSDLVVAAKERVQDATDAVTKAREDGAEREAAAAQRVSEAEEAGAERVAAAKEALADTERNAARQREEAAESVADAELRLKDAQDDAAKSAGAAAGGTNAYADALAKLSPNARAFVEAIRQIKPAWEEMQKAVQNAFFEGFADKVKDLSGKYLPVLKEGMIGIAGAMNKMALYAADALMKPEVVEAVNVILGNTKKLFDNAGTALGDFIEGFLKLAGIGSDFLPGIGTWLANIARDFKDWVTANPDKIRQFITDGLQTLKDIWDVLVEVGRLFVNLFTGNADGTTFLHLLRDVIAFLADHADVVKAVMYALAAGWVVSKVAGFASAVMGVIGLVGTLAARIRGLPPLPGGAGRALGTAALVAAPIAAAYAVTGAVSGRFADDPTAKSDPRANGGFESSQQGAAGFHSLLDSLGSLGTGDTGPIAKWWDDQMTVLQQDVADVGNSPLGQFVTNLTTQWQVGWDAFSEWWGGFWEGLGTGLSTWWNDTIVVPMGEAITWINDRWNEFSEWFVGLWEGLKTGISTWWNDTIVVPLGIAIQWINDRWTEFSTWFSGLWESLKQGLLNWWNNTIVIPVGNALRWISDRWNEFSAWFWRLWENLKSGLINWWNTTVVIPVSNAVDWIRNKWMQFWDWLNQKRIEISGGLSRMWDGLTGGARSAINGAIGFLNGLITGVNRAISGLNSINPFGSIGYVGYIPYLAKGGIASGMAIVGERGPELVNLGAGAQVHTAGDTRRMLGQGGGGGPVEVVLRIEGGNDALSSLLMRMQRTGELQLLPAS